MARLWRSLKGWRVRSPHRSRRPRAWPEVAAVAMYFLETGEFMKAVWTLVAFGGYLRPSDNMRLRKQDLVPPVGSLSHRWCLVLNSEDYNLTSKTGVSDESIIWDNEETEWMGAVFSAIKASGPPASPVYQFDYPEMAESFRGVTEILGIAPFVPYQLRHSGPSWDRLHRRRSQAAIMKRGRWRSLASLARYEKGGMVTKQFLTHPQKLRDHMERCAQHLRAVMLGERAALKFQ